MSVDLQSADTGNVNVNVSALIAVINMALAMSKRRRSRHYYVLPHCNIGVIDDNIGA